ncbi:doxorubicin biosynthesis protein DnrV [Streptomyces sp. SAJ15]|nr:VOC family protein [Streptomyces sp. SAJ15]TVL93074.1 doxorubicin biosynthesis protein DnrV [Streptomyces sp. SAJ15]
MTTATSRGVQGAPCWVSLTVPDLKAAQDFYAAVLGWEYKPGFQGQGSYSVALAKATPVAGIGAASGLGRQAVWTAYFVADSADVVASRIRERGATVAVGPLEFGNGRVAWAADPFDAVFGIWEGAVDPEWQVGRTAGAPAWLELRTRDPFASAMFYGGVFDWDVEGPRKIDVRYEHDRVMLSVGGHTVAGIYGGGVETAPDPHLRPQWHVYFCVDDVEAAVDRADAAGGTVITRPRDTPFGPMASVRDPQGALFHLSSEEIEKAG